MRPDSNSTARCFDRRRLKWNLVGSLCLAAVLLGALMAAPSCTNSNEMPKQLASNTRPATHPSFSDDSADESSRAAAAKSLGFSYPPSPTSESSRKRSDAQLAANSASRLQCHTTTDAHTMHKSGFGRRRADAHRRDRPAMWPHTLRAA